MPVCPFARFRLSAVSIHDVLASWAATAVRMLRKGGIFALQLIANALSAYAFQKVFAYIYGVSVDKTIFDIAFAVPFILIYASGFGMTHSIVVVLFSQDESQQNAELASQRFSTLLNFSLLAVGALVFVVALCSTPLTVWLAPGLTPLQRDSTRQLLVAFLPLAVTFGVGSYLSAVAIAYRLPISQELLLLVARLVVVVWMLRAGDSLTLLRLAYVYVIATVVTLMAQWLLIRRRTPLRYAPTLQFGDPHVKAAIHQFVGFMFVALVGQFAAAYTRRIGTTIGPAVVATISFAIAILEPAGTILGKSILFVYGPRLASAIDHKADAEALAVLRIAIVASALAACAIAVMLYWAMPEVMLLLFGGGAFDKKAVVATVEVARMMVIQVPFHLLTWVTLYPLLAAARQAAAITYLVGYVSQIAFVKMFAPSLGMAGLALSYPFFTAMQAFCGLLLLGLVVRSRRVTQLSNGRVAR